MDKKLFISLTPGKTFLDRLTGKSKTRAFLLITFILAMTWDIRIIAPFYVLSLIALISIKPDKKKNIAVTIIVILMNLFNLLLIWFVEPDYGVTVVGGSTKLLDITESFFITSETLWYFGVRFCKMMASFNMSLTFIQCITPSELAAGLHSIKVPYKICTIFSLAFRYIPDIARDFENIRISMQTRGLELDSRKSSIFARLKQYVLILVPLIITSFERVGNIANAMDLRGFGKKKDRTYYSEHEDTKGDKVFFVVNILLLILLILTIVAKYSKFYSYEVWSPWIS